MAESSMKHKLKGKRTRVFNLALLLVAQGDQKDQVPDEFQPLQLLWMGGRRHLEPETSQWFCSVAELTSR